MKIKTKIKDYVLTVRIKIPSEFGYGLNQREIEYFTNKPIRTFMKPKGARGTIIEFTGTVGIALSDRLRRPINKYDFFFIIEQIVDAFQKLQAAGFGTGKVLWEQDNIFINESTKELQLIFLPYTDGFKTVGDVMQLIESIIYSSKPTGEYDSDFVSRFAYYLRTLQGFDTEAIEEFIKTEDRSIINTIKATQIGGGFNIDSRREYHQQTEQKQNEQPTLVNKISELYEISRDDDEATGLLVDDNEATGLLVDNDDYDSNATGLLTEDDGTMLLKGGAAHYPTLQRTETGENILVNKPVFRLGKERSYVDYFVANNNSVSRSHADIVTRGTRHYVIDLNSKNKTYINGVTLQPQAETEIFDGDCLVLANEEFIFRE